MFTSDLLRCPTWRLALMWPSWQPARRSGSRHADLAAHVQPWWLIKDSRHLLTPRAHVFCRSEQVLHGKMRRNAEVNLCVWSIPQSLLFVCGWIIDRSIKLWALWTRTTPSWCRLSRYTPSTPHTAPLWAMNWLLFTVRRGGIGLLCIHLWNNGRRMAPPFMDIKRSGSAARTSSGSLFLEERCHMAGMKGNNYLLEFLPGLVQFRIIIHSLRVINTGIMPTSIWYASSLLSEISLGGPKKRKKTALRLWTASS